MFTLCSHQNDTLKGHHVINGSCLCGTVKFQISGEPSSLSYCHCSRCRKSAGVFSAVLIGKADDLSITQGEDAIARFMPETDAKFERCFCQTCGTSLGDMASGDYYVVAASALDDDPKIRPTLHIHTASKPDWYEIVDDLKKFDGDYIPDA
ncbi:GFA family protein [Rhodobacteraceae bacterium CY05]|uniref:GFA family protein n=1 Tax=Parasedimentitalea huanghaiensis TaxID=2682100 RepID=A0A6L6WDR1_9RHOB|nr:GFA family protein [Zongyanglinia huanghaiensis]MVO15630.1 GFA family protein [Zongyanglinia huanghaiensis]